MLLNSIEQIKIDIGTIIHGIRSEGGLDAIELSLKDADEESDIIRLFAQIVCINDHRPMEWHQYCDDIESGNIGKETEDDKA